MELWVPMCLVFGGAVVFQVLAGVWTKALNEPLPEAPVKGPVPTTTVLVPARNAGDTLAPLLQDLHAQQGLKAPAEVLVVDDGSTDATAQLALSMAAHWPQLRVLEAEGAGKKAAITTGVRAAHGALLVQTDADVRCGPDRSATIAEIASRTRADLLLMPVATDGHGWLGAMQEVEQAALFLVALGTARAGRPLLANGANMAYTAEAFDAVRGFEGDVQASGDDVHLVLRMRTAGRQVAYLHDPRVVVRTAAAPDVQAFLAQRLRWAGKMHAQPWRYKWGPALGMAFPWCLLWLTFTVDWTAQLGHGLLYSALLLIGAWVLWCDAALRLVRKGQEALGQRYRTVVALFGLCAMHVHAPIIGLLSIFIRPQWKGRRV